MSKWKNRKFVYIVALTAALLLALDFRSPWPMSRPTSRITYRIAWLLSRVGMTDPAHLAIGQARL